MSIKKLVSGTAIMTVLISFVYIAGISFTATEMLPAAWAQDKDADEYVDVEEMASAPTTQWDHASDLKRSKVSTCNQPSAF